VKDNTLPEFGSTTTVNEESRVQRRVIPKLNPTRFSGIILAFALSLASVAGPVVAVELLTTAPAAAPAQQVDTTPVGPVGFTATTLLQTSTTVKGQPIRFPQGDDQFTAVLGEIAPGGQAGRHMHPVPLLVYILEGSLSIEMEGHGTHDVSAGEAFTEVINTWHNGRNLGTTPAKFLIVFAGQDGTPITIRP
jgi:quercetin dioxygenase-like cupin family protein